MFWELTCLSGLTPPGELAPHLGRSLVGVFLQGTRDPDQSVRASSLSNLGELCQKLDYSLGPLAQEVRGSTHCAKSTAQTGYRSYLSKNHKAQQISVCKFSVFNKFPCKCDNTPYDVETYFTSTSTFIVLDWDTSFWLKSKKHRKVTEHN